MLNKTSILQPTGGELAQIWDSGGNQVPELNKENFRLMALKVKDLTLLVNEMTDVIKELQENERTRKRNE